MQHKMVKDLKVVRRFSGQSIHFFVPVHSHPNQPQIAAHSHWPSLKSPMDSGTEHSLSHVWIHLPGYTKSEGPPPMIIRHWRWTHMNVRGPCVQPLARGCATLIGGRNSRGLASSFHVSKKVCPMGMGRWKAWPDAAV